MPGEALLWNAFRSWKIITQLCDLPRSIQFYVPFWGQIPKVKPHNSFIFNKLNQKASPAFALIPLTPLSCTILQALPVHNSFTLTARQSACRQNTEQPVDNPASIHHLRHLYVHSLVWSNRSFIKTFMMGHIVYVSVG